MLILFKNNCIINIENIFVGFHKSNIKIEIKKCIYLKLFFFCDNVSLYCHFLSIYYILEE